MTKKIAVVGAILENPKECQKYFNSTVADFKDIIRGRMGIPFEDSKVSVVSIVVLGTLDEINHLTGKLGNIKGITVKTSISKKEV
ncbi:MAG: TM1266 family iron-only hydrogenase system putative regulator [Tissierella sp.]|uniref:TM1266 family iron-only hydrogenase system putative regulator n=1 Tax=Tissierella sp. TaxID=41274 RepID=UPI003F977EBE